MVWQSNFTKKFASKMYSINDSGYVIYNGDDPKAYRVEKIPSDGKFHVFTCANWIGHDGRYRPEKRMHEMIRIADEYTKKNPDVVFWFIGDTKQPVHENKNIVFVGRISHANLARYIVSANCMLFIGWGEWCPNSVVESLVAGTPVICSRGGGAEELVKVGYGESLPSEDPFSVEALKSGTVPPINNEEVFSALDRWCRCEEKRPATSLYMEHCAKKYIEILRSIEKK